MSSYRNCLFCLTAMCIAGVASAQILDEKAGADFNYFYTGADLTSHADWTANGTFGTVAVEGTQLRFTASATAGGYYSWANALSHEAGWTMEFTFQITQPSTAGSHPFAVIACDGTAGQYNVFLMGDVGVQVRDTPLGTQNYLKDFTDAVHTVRYAEPAEGGSGDSALWVDGILYADNLTGYGQYDLVRVFLGEISGTQVDGEILIDGIAIDTTGAWAPIGQVIPVPPSVEDLSEAASDTFTYKYEMDVDPSNSAEIDLDGNGLPDFYLVYEGNATHEFTEDGTWLVNSPDQGDQCFMDGGIYFDTTVWSAADFAAADGFTYEVRAKVLSQTEGATQVFAIVGSPEDANEYGAIILTEEGTSASGAGLLDDSDNTDDFHVYRLVRGEMEVDEGYTKSAYWVWRDGVLLTEEAFSNEWGIVRDALYFGDMSGSPGGSFEVDYVRFTQGMYAPVGWTYPPADDLPGDLNGDGMVGSADLDIVRANWGATAAAAVPEPGALTLALFGLLAVLATRRR